MTPLTTSTLFDLSNTYFMIAGIAGVNPGCGLSVCIPNHPLFHFIFLNMAPGTIAFAKSAVQVSLAYEIDPRELPANLSSGTGYIPLGATQPDGARRYTRSRRLPRQVSQRAGKPASERGSRRRGDRRRLVPRQVPRIRNRQLRLFAQQR